MLITILTPTYNRSNLLPALFESLLRQTSKDFEWLIVDDGSSDNTKEVLKRMSQGSIFPVRYFYKRNGGKHTAVNMGVKNARGQLVLILDSDDELPPTAIADIAEAHKPIKGRQEFAGVCGYMAHRDGQVIGHPLVEVDASEIVLRYKYNVCGDMCEVFRTDVLREFPFPEIKDERFCPECLVWNRIARKYRLHVFPKVVYLRDYLDGGLTSNIVRIRMQSPVASMMTYAEMLDLDIPRSQKVKAAINYWRFLACLTAEHAREVKCNIPSLPLVWHWTKPLGLLMHRRDVKRNK
jgi:glycosyltransferase involved in cell wall biosynthesis